MLNFCLTYCNIVPTIPISSWKPYNCNLLLGCDGYAQVIDMMEAHSITARQETLGTMQQGKPQKPTPKEWIRPLWFLTSIGWYVVLSLVIPIAIGIWLDRPAKLNTHPLFTLIGLGLGTIIAFYGVYRMLRSFYKEQRGETKR